MWCRDWWKKFITKKVLSFIEEANDSQIQEIIKVILHRYGEDHPQWDIVFLSLPKNNLPERKRIIESVLLWDEKSRNCT